MFSYAKKVIGYITVKQTDTEIIIEGVPGYFIQNDINNVWKTSKVTAYMFNKITKNSFSIPLFFAVDLVYALETIIHHPKKIGTNRNTAKKILDELYENTWLSKTKQTHPNILNFSKLNLFYKTPLSFQNDFFDRYNDIVPKYDLNGYLLAGAAGSGKTFMGMVLGEMREADHIIVVSPLNAINIVWEKSLNSEYKKPPSYWIASDSSEFKKEKYLIVGYTSINKTINLADKIKGKIVIILDESHNLNEVSSQQTNNFIRLCKVLKPTDVLWMSGTPIKALGSESVPLLSTIDKYFTPDIADKFKKLFGKNATKATDILNNRLRIVSHKVEKKELKLYEPIIENIGIKSPDGDKFTLDVVKDVMLKFINERTSYYKTNFKKYKEQYDNCLDYFQKNTTSVKELNDLDQYKKYIKLIIASNPADLSYLKEEVIFCNRFENNEIMRSIPKEWRADFKNSKSVVKYVTLKIQGECLGRVLGKLRMECILSLSKHVDYTKIIESTVKKTIVFTSYVDVLVDSEKTITEAGHNPLVVYGKTNNDLLSIVKRFEKEETINPLIATFQSLSTAVPLVMADTVIMLNTPYRDYILQQAISRIHRLGSDTQVRVYILFLDTGSKPNLSTRTIDILKWSQEQVEKIMNIKSPFEVSDLSFSNENHYESNSDFHISLEELGIEENIMPYAEVSTYKKPSAKW